MAICSGCARNPHLKKRIEEDGVRAYCRVCGDDRGKVFELEKLASLISDAIQQNFELNPQRYFLDDGDGNDVTLPYGDSLDTVVAEMLEQDVDFFDDLLTAIVETSDHDVRDGEPDFYEIGSVYGPHGLSQTDNHFGTRWDDIVAELKHKRRFFSGSAHEFFDQLFKNVENIRAWCGEPRRSRPVVETIFSHEPVFRARIIELEDVQGVINDPFKLIGPTPRNKARPGRMSAEGVVALYCARDSATAIAELRPAIGNIVAVITMIPKRPLRVLNFERLEQALDEGWGAYLAPDSDTVYNTRVFLRNLHSLISQPVVPGHESDYLITQTMAEYLAHVHNPNFDGIIFKSVQHSGGINLVLFADKENLDTKAEFFPVDYVSNSLSFSKVGGVVYSHLPLEPVSRSTVVSV